MRIEVLGESRLLVGGDQRPLPRGVRGLLLQRLLLQPNEVIAGEELMGALWPGIDRATGARRLRVAVSRLRGDLDGVAVEATDHGYRLRASGASLDRIGFERLAARSLASGDTGAAGDALDLWRGAPYSGFITTPVAQRQRHRLIVLHARLRDLVDGETTPTLHRSGGLVQLAPPVEGAVARPRALGHLPAAGSKPVIGVVAPAGFGKSVLLAQWARREGDRVAWHRLTGGDDDPAVFWRSLGLAFAAAGAGRLAMLAGDARTPPRDLVSRIINELLEVRTPLAVVLDDVQRITDPDLHRQLEGFVRRCPDHHTLALASRQSLPIPTARLCAEGRMIAIEAETLAFTEDEAAAALTGAPDPWCSGAGARRVYQMTSGWPQATTALAAADPTGTPGERSETRRNGTDLLDEVLADLDDHLVDLLVDTAHLDELDGEVCTAVTGLEGSDRLLAELATRHHVLLEPEPHRYRHRPMLSGLLRERLRARGADHVDRVHRRAARWHLERGSAGKAMELAVAGHEPDLAGEALGPAMAAASARGDAATVQRWLTTIDPRTVATDAVTHDLCVLLSGFLDADHRRRWMRSRRRRDPGDVVLTTAIAIDLLREGRCLDSLEAIAKARDNLRPGVSGPAGTLLTGLLAAAEADCHTLLGHGASPRLEPLDIDSTLEHSPWAWVSLWALGQRALLAYVAGEGDIARALMAEGRDRCSTLDRTWQLLGDGTACLTNALLDSESATTATEHRRAMEAIEEIARRSDDLGRVPMGIIARYALSAAHRRDGNHTVAAERLEEADRGLTEHPQLAFLHRVRHRLCEPGRPETTGPTGSDPLTPKERLVLRHLNTDLTLAEIAHRLYLSRHTVKAHVRSIYRKLGVHRRSDAIRHQSARIG